MIVIPMAGMSSRFFKAGYTLPKYMLKAHGQTLFALSIKSFSEYFDKDDFLFVTLNQYDTPAFVENQCRQLGIHSFDIVAIPEVTRGQAETVAVGLENTSLAGDMSALPITIFNCDTALPGFRQPDFADDCDGYLDVFIGSGANWSYVRPHPDEPGRAIETTEKNPISDLCSSGLYHFRRAADFLDVFRLQLEGGVEALPLNEFYIAPMYNELIRRGADIRYRVTDEDGIVFFGVPDEYDALLARLPDSLR